DRPPTIGPRSRPAPPRIAPTRRTTTRDGAGTVPAKPSPASKAMSRIDKFRGKDNESTLHAQGDGSGRSPGIHPRLVARTGGRTDQGRRAALTVGNDGDIRDGAQGCRPHGDRGDQRERRR